MFQVKIINRASYGGYRTIRIVVRDLHPLCEEVAFDANVRTSDLLRDPVTDKFTLSNSQIRRIVKESKTWLCERYSLRLMDQGHGALSVDDWYWRFPIEEDFGVNDDIELNPEYIVKPVPIQDILLSTKTHAFKPWAAQNKLAGMYGVQQAEPIAVEDANPNNPAEEDL